jgi:hypothetical protein
MRDVLQGYDRLILGTVSMYVYKSCCRSKDLSVVNLLGGLLFPMNLIRGTRCAFRRARVGFIFPRYTIDYESCWSCCSIKRGPGEAVGSFPFSTYKLDGS